MKRVVIEEHHSVISTSRQTQGGFEFRMSRAEDAEHTLTHDMPTQLIVKAKATELHSLSQRNEAVIAERPVDNRGRATTRNNARPL